VAWTANGVPVRVITTDGDSWSPVITTDDSSRAIITWQDERLGNKNIYAQKLDGDDGSPMWVLNGVPVRVLAGSDALLPVIATDGQGGAVIAWQDERSGDRDIYAQRIDTDGAPLWTPAEGMPVRVVAGSDTADPYMVPDGYGGSVIAWQDARDGVNRIYVQRLINDAPSVTGVDPDHGFSDGVTSVTVTGDWFYPGARVWLSMDGQPDIDATNVNVTNRNLITCDVSPDMAQGGTWKLHVTNTDGQTNSEDVDFEIEYAPPLVNWINPSVGNQGEVPHTLVVVGAHFRDVQTIIELHKDAETIEAFNITFKTVNVMWADIVIPDDATLGSWDCYVMHDDDLKNFTLHDAFTMRKPQIDTVTPSQGYADITYSVSIAGTNTNWTMTPLEVDAGDGITVSNIAAVDDRHLTADFTISRYPTPGPRDITVTAGNVPQQVTLGDGFTVVPPSIAGCEPTSVVQGHTANVDIVGDHTHFKNGISHTEFSGTGITVNSTDVTDATTATTNITVAVDAPVGHQDVNVITGREVPKPLRGVFTVKEAPSSPPHIDSVDPDSGTVGTHVTVSGEHFGTHQGQSYVTFKTVDVMWADIAIPDDATLGSWDCYVMHDDDMKDFTLHDAFTMRKPQIDTVTPSQGYAGITYRVSIAGTNTNWTMTPLEVDAGDGITVSNIAAVDDRHLTADFTISKYPTPGPRDVTVTAGSIPQRVTLGGGFTVVPPSIAGCEPTSVVQGHTANVDIVGDHTHFKNGTSYTEFSGTGITVNSTDVTDATNVTTNITVAVDAPVGHQDVTVITGSELPTPLKGVFTVKEAPSSPPHIDSVDPDSGTVGTHVTVSGKHFGTHQGQSYVTFNGTGVNSYSSWSDGKVVCQVPSGATTGPVTVTTPAGTSNGIGRAGKVLPL
jgi:hypothetical protein